MRKKQYNNIIEHTLKHEKTNDSLETARAIFKNMGVALPQGDVKEVSDILKTNSYMGWKACDSTEAQKAADRGIAAIGVDDEKIIVLSANDEEQPVEQTASVMTLSNDDIANDVSTMQYYVYSNITTDGTTPGGGGDTTQDDLENIFVPFKAWVTGQYGHASRKYCFTANAPNAHRNGGTGRYTITVRSEEEQTLHLYRSSTGDEIYTKTGKNFETTNMPRLEYNEDYHFIFTKAMNSDNYFEIRIDYHSYPAPHGNYLTFTCNRAAICNDGKGDDYNDRYNQGHTAFMGDTLNADIHRYIVIPGTYPDCNSLLGCVGVAVREDGTYCFGVVGDKGPNRDLAELDEFSVKMIEDLGFSYVGGISVDPEEPVTTYIFPNTKQNWDGETLNECVEYVGRFYYY